MEVGPKKALSPRVHLELPPPSQRAVSRTLRFRPRTPNSAYADASTADQATLIASRASKGRPHSAGHVPGRAFRNQQDFDAIEHTVPVRSVHETVRTVRLEVAPFLLSRHDLVHATRVSLRGRELYASDAAKLALAISGGALHLCDDLDLGGCRFADEGMEALSIALGGGAMPRLTSLYLCGNGIGDDGMTFLAAALRRGGLSSLEALYLGRNHIGDAGIDSLASSCSARGGLSRCRLLQLSYNQFGDAGLSAFAAAASERRAFPKLERLWLNHNDYFELGSIALAQALDGGFLKGLRELHIDDPESVLIKVTGMKAACKTRSITLGAGRVLQPWKTAPRRHKCAGKMRVGIGIEPIDWEDGPAPGSYVKMTSIGKGPLSGPT